MARTGAILREWKEFLHETVKYLKPEGLPIGSYQVLSEQLDLSSFDFSYADRQNQEFFYISEKGKEGNGEIVVKLDLLIQKLNSLGLELPKDDLILKLKSWGIEPQKNKFESIRIVVKENGKPAWFYGIAGSDGEKECWIEMDGANIDVVFNAVIEMLPVVKKKVEDFIEKDDLNAIKQKAEIEQKIKEKKERPKIKDIEYCKRELSQALKDMDKGDLWDNLLKIMKVFGDYDYDVEDYTYNNVKVKVKGSNGDFVFSYQLSPAGFFFDLYVETDDKSIVSEIFNVVKDQARLSESDMPLKIRLKNETYQPVSLVLIKKDGSKILIPCEDSINGLHPGMLFLQKIKESIPQFEKVEIEALGVNKMSGVFDKDRRKMYEMKEKHLSRMVSDLTGRSTYVTFAQFKSLIRDSLFSHFPSQGKFVVSDKIRVVEKREDFFYCDYDNGKEFIFFDVNGGNIITNMNSVTSALTSRGKQPGIVWLHFDFKDGLVVFTADDYKGRFEERPYSIKVLRALHVFTREVFALKNLFKEGFKPLSIETYNTESLADKIFKYFSEKYRNIEHRTDDSYFKVVDRKNGKKYFGFQKHEKVFKMLEIDFAASSTVKAYNMEPIVTAAFKALGCDFDPHKVEAKVIVNGLAGIYACVRDKDGIYVKFSNDSEVLKNFYAELEKQLPVLERQLPVIKTKIQNKSEQNNNDAYKRFRSTLKKFIQDNLKSSNKESLQKKVIVMNKSKNSTTRKEVSGNKKSKSGYGT